MELEIARFISVVAIIVAAVVHLDRRITRLEEKLNHVYRIWDRQLRSYQEFERKGP